MLRILFLFTFIMPIISWAQPPVKDVKQESAVLKKETSSSFSKKKKTVKTTDTKKQDYYVDWTDDQDCTLKVVYDNNKVKEVRDYGLIGTFGLKKLYQQLFELRFNQDWKKINTTVSNGYK